MFNLLRSISNQELFEKHLYNPCILKERNGAMRPSYISYHLRSEVSIMLHCWLCSTCYTAVQIKNCSKSTSVCYQNSHRDKYGQFRYERKSSRAIAKSTLFAISKDEWDTKEDTGKSMKNVLYILWYAKGTCRAKAMLNSKKNQARSLSCYRVTLV